MAETPKLLPESSVNERRDLLARMLRDRAQRPVCGPLSFGQERLWFLENLSAGSSAYVIAVAFRLTGRLDGRLMEEAFRKVEGRHESLRTSFKARNGEPLQVVSNSAPIAIRLNDLQHLPANTREAAARSYIDAEARRPFDLCKSPLIRVYLVRLEPDIHILMIVLHHIIADGWSVNLLLSEVSAIYSGAASGGAFPLPAVPLQQRHLAEWQRHPDRAAAHARHLAYWRRRIDGLPALIDLHTDGPRPRLQDSSGGVVRFALRDSTVKGLAQLSRQTRCTLFMTVLSAFQILLARYSGRDDIGICSPVANRSRIEWEQVIGFFANTLIVRADLSGNPTFREFLARVRRSVLDAYAHQDLPFERRGF
jgi:Condensation domain